MCFSVSKLDRMEKVNIRSSKSISKILGTGFCVCGANAGTAQRQSKHRIITCKSFFALGGENWLMGCLFLFAC